MRWRLKVSASKAAAAVVAAAAGGAGERAGQRRFLEAEGVFRELAAKQERIRHGLEAEVRTLKGDLSAAVLSKAELLREQELWERDTATRVDELEAELIKRLVETMMALPVPGIDAEEPKQKV